MIKKILAALLLFPTFAYAQINGDDDCPKRVIL